MPNQTTVDIPTSEARSSSAGPRAPASATSRLLTTPSSASASSSSSPRSLEAQDRSNAVGGRSVVNGKTSSPSLVLGKRPSASSTTPFKKEESIGPRIVSAAAQQNARPALEYADWEVDQVGTVFSVTLDVSTSSVPTNLTMKCAYRKEKLRKAPGVYAG